jgi:hypothetical protein
LISKKRPVLPGDTAESSDALMTKKRPSVLQRLFSRLSPASRGNGGNLDLEQLTHLVRRYSIEQQQVPKDLEDLVAMKYLDSLPSAPEGHRFVVDRKTAEVRLD